MKNLFVAFLLSFLSTVASAYPNDVWIKRSNNTDTGTIEYTINTEVDGIAWFNIISQRMEYLRFGNGISRQLIGDYYYLNATGSASWGDITGKPTTFAPSSHSHPMADLSDSTATGRAVVGAVNSAAARAAIGAGTSSFSGDYSMLSGIPSAFNPIYHTHTVSDLNDASSFGQSLITMTNASSARALLGSGTSNFSGAYSDLTGKPTIPPAMSLTTTGSGAATYNSSTGALNIPAPAPASATPFNFSSPATKAVAVSTAYQAADTSKAAIVTVSPSCQNATTVVASSSCVIQVRQSPTSGLTCSNGTVAMTWSSTVQLGLVFTQTSGSPFDVKLPSGGYFILCATAGTFTLSAVEQSAG